MHSKFDTPLIISHEKALNCIFDADERKLEIWESPFDLNRDEDTVFTLRVTDPIVNIFMPICFQKTNRCSLLIQTDGCKSLSRRWLVEDNWNIYDNQL